MPSFKRIWIAFAACWIAHATHWYFVSEFSKFKRFDPLWSAVVAILFTAACVIVGLVFRWKPARAFWTRLGWWSLSLSVAGVVLLAIDYTMKLQWSDMGDPYPPRWFSTVGYFLSGFPWLFLPKKEEPNKASTANALDVT
ncbi:MAG: hypothetical protein ABI273_14245 [Lacunisphaera sp.]